MLNCHFDQREKSVKLFVKDFSPTEVGFEMTFKIFKKKLSE
jgi:hypothetical protein